MPRILLSDLVVTHIVAVNRINHNITKTIFRENRDCWAISLKLVGRTVYESCGKSFVSDKEHVVLLPKGSTYACHVEELGECFMIEFEADYSEVPEISVYSSKYTLNFSNLISQLERVWTFKKPAYELNCLAGLYQILAKLRERELCAYHSSEKYRLIEPSIRYLEENYYDTSISIDRLAAISGISSVYFRKLFFSVYNDSPMRYLRMIRIEKAKDLLASDFTSISGIASDVGFESVYHFSKSFKKVTGCSPSEYRRLKKREGFS
ncbi:MAG: helix-turn-helix domain-containing protein [Eubacteriales bacterium]